MRIGNKLALNILMLGFLLTVATSQGLYQVQLEINNKQIEQLLQTDVNSTS